MKKSTVFIVFFACLALFACNKSESDINEEYSSGVVLIKNTGYYELKINDELSAYFTNYSEEKGLENFTVDKDSIVMATSFGTGFFISDKGEIATNNHVVGSMVSEKQALKAKGKILTDLKGFCRMQYNSYEQALGEINNALLAYYFYDTYDAQYYELSQAQELCKQYMQAYSDTYDYLCDVDGSNVDFAYINKISIAYNDEYITGETDFTPCVLKSSDPENDIAIIQLKNKKTPQDKHIFEIPKEDPIETKSLFYPNKNEKLFMLGFNLGPTLALTKDGVKSQCTTGAISQKRDNNYMYSIPALPGSSGSPVLNRKGELVAINFAGIGSTQNFNYGIKVKYLRNLINK